MADYFTNIQPFYKNNLIKIRRNKIFDGRKIGFTSIFPQWYKNYTFDASTFHSKFRRIEPSVYHRHQQQDTTIISWMSSNSSCSSCNNSVTHYLSFFNHINII